MVNCCEVQCEGACDAGSAEVYLVSCSAKALGHLVVKAMRSFIVERCSVQVHVAQAERM